MDPIDGTGQPRPVTRRERQLGEIATLVAEGATDRATGLALEHLAEFPDDAELLGRMTGTHSTEEMTR